MLAATELIDDLPDIEGVAEHWGGDVIHCPFCHGYEVRDRRIVQIVTHPMGLHPAGLFRLLTARLTLVLHDGVDSSDPGLDELRAAGVTVVDTPVQRLVTGDDGHVATVELTTGERIDADAIVVGAPFCVRRRGCSSSGGTRCPSGSPQISEAVLTTPTACLVPAPPSPSSAYLTVDERVSDRRRARRPGIRLLAWPGTTATLQPPTVSQRPFVTLPHNPDRSR